MSRAPGGQDDAEPPKGLKRYKILSLVGDGTYGLVYLALNTETREKVAVKTMKRKYHSWDEVMALREVRSLKKLHHPNVVRLKEVIRENSRLYFVFEYLRADLLGIMRERTEPFQEAWIRNVVFQLLQGLSYMHRLGFFHRDLKPENILCGGGNGSNADVTVKIADFGLAREIRSAPPFTDYVSTRWYRAPEVLLRSTSYNSPIDVWAIGCITTELYTKRPLFPGTSEIDQLYKICSILGTPGKNDWQEGFTLANAMSFRFPTFSPTHLSQVLGSRASARSVSFLYTLLAWNPSWRSSAQEALKHAYFRGPRGVSAVTEANSASATGNVSIRGGSSSLVAPQEVAGAAMPIVGLQRGGAGSVAKRTVVGAAGVAASAATEDFEQLRNSLRKKKSNNNVKFNVPPSKSVDDLNRNLSDGGDEDYEDISDLISAFGLSPEKKKRPQPQREAKRRIPVAGSLSSGVSGPEKNTLQERLPRFSNLDPDGTANNPTNGIPSNSVGQQRRPRLVNNMSSLGPQANSISSNMPKLSFGSSKYAALLSRRQSQQEQQEQRPSSPLALAHSPTFDLPKAARDSAGTKASFSLNRALAHQSPLYVHHQYQNGNVGSGFHHRSPSPPPLSQVKSKYFPPFRSLPNFGGGMHPQQQKQQKEFTMRPPNNGLMPVAHPPFAHEIVGNGQAAGGGQGKQFSSSDRNVSATSDRPPRPVIQVRTNWAAKYLK